MESKTLETTPPTALKNNVDVETTVKDQVVKAVKTKQNAESKLAINTWVHILK